MIWRDERRTMSRQGRIEDITVRIGKLGVGGNGVEQGRVKKHSCEADSKYVLCDLLSQRMTILSIIAHIHRNEMRHVEQNHSLLVSFDTISRSTRSSAK
jgi:hypothetical protein